MNHWKDAYEKKFISPAEAANFVKSGDYVVFTGGREAHAIGLAIAARKEELRNVEIWVPSPGYDFGWYDEGWQDSFAITIGIPTATCQEAVDRHLVDINFYSIIPFDVEARQPDILLTEISSPDEHGFCSFGASLWAKKRQIKNSKLVIAEVNSNLIRTYGENYVHVSEIDYFVEHISMGGAPGLGSLGGRAIKEAESFLRNIAEHVSELVDDGSTLQIGIGRTTEPLVGLGMLDGKHDLGYHSEATPAGIISLVRRGVITGKRKTLNADLVIVTSIGGSTKEEMEWVDNNPAFHLVDVGYLEDIRVIAAHDNMVAINNALAVDLTGQIAAESLGTRLLSIAGGQIPFVVGAFLSKRGRCVTVLPSTALGGKTSRIMPSLPEGTVVTIQRNLADCVVTEYGIARLKGKSIRQRAQELIAVAHPDFRPDLKKAAQKLYWP